MAVQLVRHRSQALAGNACGDPVERDLYVYTPPGYDAGEDRYPVLWCLTGFTGTGAMALSGNPWAPGLPDRLDRLIADGCPPVIVAFPDCFTRFGGSQYLNSSTLGRYEDYLCDELVVAVDSKFRTRPDVRGVFGKSSGGYGALRLAMRRPGMFQAVASHSGDMGFAFCYVPDFAPAAARIDAAGSLEAWFEHFASKEKKASADFPAINVVGMAAAYSPDPDRPLGVALPFDPDTGEILPDVWQRWLRHDPARMIDDPANARALKDLRLLFCDCGTADEYQLHLGLQLFEKRCAEHGVPIEVEWFADNHRSLGYRYDVSVPKLAAALS
ncbi:MAG: esterase family protein [Planctomycetota bacterium]|nr:esterase family protein [Planctomycetota bacterium]